MRFVFCFCVPVESASLVFSIADWLLGFPCSLSEGRSSRKILCFVPPGGPLLYENITFVYNSEQLNGTQRVLLDNVLSQEQCRELHSVANVRTREEEPLKLAYPDPRREKTLCPSVLSLQDSVLEEGSPCARVS